MRLIAGWDLAVARWVGDRLDIADFGPCRAIGVADGDDLIAGVVFNNYRYPNIEATLASTSPRWCSNSILRGIFSYPFQQLDCTRLTAVTSAKNQPTRAFLCRLGFREEGVMRRAFRNGDDAVIHGLLADECRWLRHRGIPDVERRHERPGER